MDNYYTIISPSEGQYRDRGSKFLAYCFPVKNIEEVEEYLMKIKTLHPKARHHCYAYRLGLDGNQFRSYDDGEPSHSAGLPILGQIDSFGLTNILIIVVRYFGGKLLGVNGLIKAYRESAADGLQNAKIVTRENKKTWKIKFDFALFGPLHYIIGKLDLEIGEKDLNFPYIIVKTPITQSEQLLDQVIAHVLRVHPESIKGRRKYHGIEVIPTD